MASSCLQIVALVISKLTAVVWEGDETWRLYVGSATGQWGCLQRWYDYYKGRCTTRHGRASSDPSSTMNLRCLAHYGLSPDPFLPNLAEGMFMVLLGTVNKTDDSANRFYCSDTFYKVFESVRSDSNLATPLAKGLNATWVFAQGWRNPGPIPGSKCINCQRVVPPRNDPSYHVIGWRYMDPLHPSSKHIKCGNCVAYQRVYGRERSREMEEEREIRNPPKLRSKPTHPKPAICEWPGCPATAQHFYGPKKMYLCKTHYGRARHGCTDEEINKETKIRNPPKLRSKPTHPKPATCEWPSCTATAQLFCGPKKMYLCKTHYRRAHRGWTDEEMNTPKGLRVKKPKQATLVSVQEKEGGRVVQPQPQSQPWPQSQPQPWPQPQSQLWP